MKFYTEYSKKYKRLVINLLGLKLKIKLLKFKPRLDCPNIEGNYEIMRDYIYTAEQRNNIEKRVLVVFPNNFVRNDAGNSSYMYNIARALKKIGYKIDFLGIQLTPGEFDDFDIYNDGLVENFYLYDKTVSNKKSKFEYYCNSWVTDELLDLFKEIIAKNVYTHINIHYVQLQDLIRLNKIDFLTKVVLSISDFDAFQTFYKDKNYDYFSMNITQEASMMKYSDSITFISQDEKQFFQRFFDKSSTYWLPHFLEQKECVSTTKDIDCLFIGHSNNHNKNALIWFIDKVYNYLNSDVKITICGKVCELLKKENPDYYEKMLRQNFQIINFAENLDDVYARTKISVVPMLTGTGLKTKTVASMSYGIPVVTTELGVDGFRDKFESGCLVANEPEEFARFVNRLLEDENFYNEISNKTKAYYENNFTLQKNIKVLEKVFN